MIKFVTVIDGKFILYAKYSSKNCYKKSVLNGKAESISADEFNLAYEAAKSKQPFEEIEKRGE